MTTFAVNPMATTNAGGMFNTSSAGHIQGMAMDDPASRNYLAGGLLGPNETLPMWGGVAITEVTTPVAQSGVFPVGNLGGYITRATSAAAITGISVFNQDHSMISTPQSLVPVAAPLMSVHFYRFGSNARVPLAIDPVLISMEGNSITQPVSWDFNLQQLVPYVPVYAAATPTGYAYNSSTGILALTFAAAPGPVTGNQVVLTGMLPAALNGSYTVASTGSGGTVLNLQVASGLGGITPSAGGLAAGGGAFPCRILDVHPGNSMTVLYNSLTSACSWNYSGSTALVLL